MKKLLKILGIGTLALCLLGGVTFAIFYKRFVVQAPKKEYPTPRNLAEAQLQDLDYLTLFIDADKSFDTEQKRTAFFNQIDSLKSKIPMDEHRFLMGIAKTMAQSKNTHTNISPSFLAKKSNAIPLRFHWFENDLHVVLVQKPYHHLLGRKVKCINGKKPTTILKKLGHWYGGSHNRLKFYSPLYFMSPELLNAINCGNSQNTIELIYEDEDSAEEQIIIEASDEGKDDVGYWPPHWLNNGLMLSKEQWLTFKFNGTVAIPFQNTNKKVSHYLLDEGLYVQLNENANTDILNIDKYLKNVLHEIKDTPLDYAILDLRFNPGGDYHIGRSFIKSVNKKLKDKPFYIVTGNGTFSAGIMTAAIAKDIANENSFIIGEPVGDNLQFWADGGSIMSLPNSKISLRIWTAYHDWENGCKDWSKCFWITIFDGVKVDDLHPDKQVSLKFSEYISGDDSVLNTILGMKNR